MAEHPNAARIRALFAAFGAGDLPAIEQVLSADTVWHFPGRRGRLAGDHRGREGIFTFFMQVQALTNHTFHLDLVDVVANDTHAVALFRGHGERDGKTLDNPTCLHLRMAEGRVTEVWEYVWDLFTVDDFWS